MKDKKIVVTLKYFKGELNPFDGAALECALQSGATDITVLAMAPTSALPAFTSLTRLGVKGVFITDPLYAGSDTIATSYILSAALKRLNPDLIFCGRQSVDGDTAQVPPMLSERLGYGIKTQIVDIDGEEVITRNGEKFIPEKNTVLTFERSKALRFPSIFSKLREVEIWDDGKLKLEKERCGLNGSPTRVKRSYESEVGRRFCRFATFAELDELIQKGLKAKKSQEINVDGEKLERVCFVGNVREKAEQIAREIIELTINEGGMYAFIEKLRELKPQAVLFEDDEKTKIFASKVAAKMEVGICADCISFRVENGQLIMTRPAQGGNITADIVATGEIAFATVRTARQDCSDIVFSVGKGAIPYIEQIKALAKKYGADVCASRIVVDNGKMPYLSQVGLTGKTVAPKVYVAFGISGAVQHTCAISGAGRVIAINEDKQARIFDYADYGIVADIKNLF